MATPLKVRLIKNMSLYRMNHYVFKPYASVRGNVKIALY